MNSVNHVPPVRLRPTTERAIGTTAFFRNRPLYDVLLKELKKQGGDYYKVMFHACSIGAEVYSFIIQYALGGYVDDFVIEVHATDLEPGFVEFAQNGCYPFEILNGMTPEERSFFVEEGGGVCVVPDLKQVVNFMNACSFTEFETDQVFNVVFLLNALVYVPEIKQAETIDNISSYNSDFLITSAFHMNSIKEDLTRKHYVPILDRQREIHDAWTDRRVIENSDELAPGIFANWRLPEFSEIADYEYKYCAIFRKENGHQG